MERVTVQNSLKSWLKWCKTVIRSPSISLGNNMNSTSKNVIVHDKFLRNSDYDEPIEIPFSTFNQIYLDTYILEDLVRLSLSAGVQQRTVREGWLTSRTPSLCHFISLRDQTYNHFKSNSNSFHSKAHSHCLPKELSFSVLYRKSAFKIFVCFFYPSMIMFFFCTFGLCNSHSNRFQNRTENAKVTNNINIKIDCVLSGSSSCLAMPKNAEHFNIC